MSLTIPGSEVPLPEPFDGERYGQLHAERIANDLAALRETYLHWEASGTVPTPSGIRLGKPGATSTVEKAGNYARREPTSHHFVNSYAHDLVRGIGAEGLEQIRAVSSTHTYSDIVPGKGRHHISTADVVALDTPQLNKTLDRLTTLKARGLGIDQTGENALLSPTEGIQHVDYNIHPYQHLHEMVFHIASTIICWAGLPDEHREPDGFRAELKERMPVLIKLDEIVQKRARYAPEFWGRSARTTDLILYRAQIDVASSRQLT